jgi:hypothetical protein
MEGNYCYKFSTIRNYLRLKDQPQPSRLADVGANIGDMSLMMHEYFPGAHIVAFEPVHEYFSRARERTRGVAQITVHHYAATHQHLFADDLGTCPRPKPAELTILKGLPAAGPGWIGGSQVLTTDDQRITAAVDERFQRLDGQPKPITLEGIFELSGFDEIDVLKIDCEGCEHSLLGSASENALRRVRFIAGEYHGIRRFYDVMHEKLFKTHKINLIGDKDLGAFFAERLEGKRDGILRYNKQGMLQLRPWLCDIPIEWHLFNEKYVLPEDRHWHALPV